MVSMNYFRIRDMARQKEGGQNGLLVEVDSELEGSI